MAQTMTAYDALLKRRFISQRVEDLVNRDRPLIANTRKDPTFSGSAMSIPVIYVAPQGLAALDLATAQATKTNTLPKNFLITVGDYFGSVDINSKVMLASRDNPGAFLSSKTLEIEQIYEQGADDIHQMMWGNGGGALCRRASISTNTVTLTEKSQIFAIEVGMTIVASTGDGSSGSDALRTGSCVITAVDRENGTFTVDAAANITSFSDNDYIFRKGDFAGNTTAQLVQGVQSYVYSTSTSVPNLWGMVRSDDPQRLAGCRVPAGDLTGRAAEDRVKLLGARMTGRMKAKCFSDLYLNPEDWQELEIALQSRGVRQVTDDSTRFGFNVLKVGIAGTTVTIFADRGCPRGTAFGLRRESWTLYSMLDMLHTVNGDGLQMLRKSASMDYEYRIEGYCQFVTNAPANNGRVPLP